jgi:hypothetical protein
VTAFAISTLKNWDGALTGATGGVAYNPSVIDPNGVAIWYSPSTNVFDDRKKLSLSVRLPSKGSQVARVQVKLVHPVMDSVDNTVKIGDCLANIELIFPKRASEAQRSALVGHLIYFMNEDNQFVQAVQDLESVY